MVTAAGISGMTSSPRIGPAPKMPQTTPPYASTTTTASTCWPAVGPGVGTPRRLATPGRLL